MLTKQEAAEYLQVSTKAVQRYTDRKLLHVTYQKRAQGGQAAMYQKSEVTALKQKMGQVGSLHTVKTNLARRDTGTGAATVQASKQTALQRRSSLIGAAWSKPTPDVRAAEKLIVTLAEAAALVSMSKQSLIEAVKNGELKAAKQGRGWKVKRRDLEAYAAKVW